MERIIGLALTRYLAHYIKNFSASNFKNWSLTDLEFKEDVVQELVGIPPEFKIKKVKCNQVYTKIPWSKLGHDPIVFVADVIELEIEEPEEIVPITKVQKKPPEQKGKQSFTQRIIDNIKFEIKELKLRIQFLGKEFRAGQTKELPPVIHVHIKDIVVHSTNSKWEVVDLQEVYKMSRNDEVLIYKEVHLGSFSLQLQPKADAKLVPIIDSLPLRVRAKVKKAFFGGPTLFFQVDFAIVEQFQLSMHNVMFKQLQDAVDAILECLYRPSAAAAPASTAAAAAVEAPAASSTSNGATTVSQVTPAPANAQPQQSKGLWGRMTSIIGSYSYWGGSSAQPAPAVEPTPQPAPEPEPEPAVTPDATNQSTDKEDEDGDDDGDGYATPEDEPPEEEFVPDEKGTVVGDEEDITYTSYSLHILRGSIDLFEYVLETTKGIVNFSFENLQLQFIPKIERNIEALKGPVKRAEARIKIDSYSMKTLSPGVERHPNYIKLVDFVERPHSSTEANKATPKIVRPDAFGPAFADADATTPMLTLDFFKLQDEPGKKPAPNSKQFFLVFRNVQILFDLAIWESMYMFFFGGVKGKRFEQYVGQNLEYMLEAALSDTMKFEVVTLSPTIILPPFAGKFPGKPHLASKVMTMHTSMLRMRSIPRVEQPPGVFSTGMFGLPPMQFPRRIEDFINDEKPISSQRFGLDIDNFWIEIQGTPTEAPQRVLQPMKLTSHIARHEFMKEPKRTAQLETFTTIDDIDFSLSQSQYQYLFEVYGERLAWNPHRMTEEKKEIIKMEKLLEAAQRGASTSDIVQVEIPDEDRGVLVSTAVHIQKCIVRLRERSSHVPASVSASQPSHRRKGSQFDTSLLHDEAIVFSTSSSPAAHASATVPERWETFAELKFDYLQYSGESQADKFVTKVSANRFHVNTPQYAQSPFPSLVSPLDSNHDGEQKPALLVRVESYKPATPTAPKPPSMTWTELNGVQICWIYFTFAKVQLFFTGNEEAAEFKDETVRQFMSTYKFSQQQAASMNWTVTMTKSELLVVETAESPECAPMQMIQGTISRKGITPEEIHFEFDGNVAFLSKMWDKQRQLFDRDNLTTPFIMKVLYRYRRNPLVDQWNTDMSLDIKDLDVSLSRRQLVMMQNIMDNQMSDIREVSTSRAQQQQKQQQKEKEKKQEPDEPEKIRLPPPPGTSNLSESLPSRPGLLLADKFFAQRQQESDGLAKTPTAQRKESKSAPARILQSSFTIRVKKMRLNLRQGKEVFAQVNMREFLYATETWNHMWTMLIEADHLAIISSEDQADRPQFATIIQPRSDFVGSQSFAGTPGKKRERSNSRPSTPSQSSSSSSTTSVSTTAARNKHRSRRGTGAVAPAMTNSPSLGSISSSSSNAVGVGLDAGSPTSTSTRLIRLRFDRRIPQENESIRVPKTQKNMKRSFSASEHLDDLHAQAPVEEEKLSWNSRWLIDIAPLQIVYSPATYQKIQEFFALLEEHKNLRRRYQQLQSEFAKLYKEQEWFAAAGPSASAAANDLVSSQIRTSEEFKQPVDNHQRREAGIIFTIGISRPLILLPDFISENIVSLIEVQASRISVSNDREDAAESMSKDLQRTDVVMSEMMMTLKTLETKHEVLNVIQTQEIIHPVTVRLQVESKMRAASGVPYTHIQCDLDLFAAVISLKKYQAMVAIANSYISKLLANFTGTQASGPTKQTSPDSSVTTPGATTPNLALSSDATSSPAPLPLVLEEDVEAVVREVASSTKAPAIERVFELTVKNLNLSVISDYMAELDLFYIHITGVDVYMSMLPGRTEFRANLRLEALVNDLNFMIPEKFIDQFYLSVNFKSGEDPDRVDRKRQKRSALSLAPSSPESTFSDTASSPSSPAHYNDSEAGTAIELDVTHDDDDDDDDDDNTPTASFEVVVLDRFQVYLTKDILRHLMEIYNLYREEGAAGEKSSDMHSHFQYILVNNTESDLLFGQDRTNEIKSLEPGSDCTFAFSNPYLPKHLVIQMDGWAKAESTVDVEEPGSALLRMQNSFVMGQLRDLVVNVVPRGLKRFVEFNATFFVTNETDRPLHFMTSRYGRSQSNVIHPTTQYVIQPGKKAPISWSKNWDMEFAVRFDDEWAYSDTFRVPRARLLSSAASETLKLKIEKPNNFLEAFLLATFTFQETAFEGVTTVNVALSAPLIIENMTAFPLWYEIPYCNALVPATIAPVSNSYFYFDTETFNHVQFKLDGYESWSRPVNLIKTKRHSVENKKNPLTTSDSEKSTVLLDVETTERLVTGQARTVYVSTAFLLVNDTDFLLFLKQRTSKSGSVPLPPRQMVPFSWSAIGRRKLSVNVGTTAWSEPIDPKDDAVHQLSIQPDTMHREYKLTMEVRSINEHTRVVVFRSWLHFRNHTNRDIQICMNYLDIENSVKPNADMAAEMTTVRRYEHLQRQASLQVGSEAVRSYLVLPKLSSTKSAVCPSTIGVSLSQDTTEWNQLPLPITKEGTYTLRMENKQDPSLFVALDVVVQEDDKGLYVTFKENADPPYIIYNNTPFPIRIRRVETERSMKESLNIASLEKIASGPKVVINVDDDEPAVSQAKPRLSYTALLDTLGALGSDVFTIEPHGKLNYYSLGLQKEEESELKFQVSVFLPEEERPIGGISSAATGGSPSKHGAMNPPSPSSRKNSPTKHGPENAQSLSRSATGARRTLFHDANDEIVEEDLGSIEHGETQEIDHEEPLIQLDDDDVSMQPEAKPRDATFKRSHNRHKSDTSMLKSSPAQPVRKKEKEKLIDLDEGDKYGTPVGTPMMADPSMRRTTLLTVPGQPQFSDSLNGSPSTSMPSLASSRHRRTPSEPGTTSANGLYDQFKPTKKAMKFRQYFSDSRAAWSDSFSVDRTGDLAIKFRRVDGGDEANAARNLSVLPGGYKASKGTSDSTRAQNLLVMSIKLQAKTKTLSFYLPDLLNDSSGNQSWSSIAAAAAQSGGSALAPTERLMQFSLAIPQFYISLQNELKRDMLWLSATGFEAEYGKFANDQQYAYVVMEDMEIDNMLPKPEYPVLFGVNHRRLFGANANLLEALFEWSSRDGRTFVDYAGLRILPFILQVDGQVIDEVLDIANYLNPQTQEQMEQQNQDPDYRERQSSKKMLREYSQLDSGVYQQDRSGLVADSSIYVDKFDVYPLDMTFSIGTNSFRWPVISEARLRLQSFHRVQLQDTPAGLVKMVGSSYISQGKAEFYKIIGNLDVIASPLANAKKFGRGLKDLFKMPYEALILDDTPGAFVAGALEGVLSLLLNTTDVTFSVLMRTTSSLSWVMQIMTLDDQYSELKASVIRQHPSNVIYGIGHGVRELARGFWLGVTDIATLPYRGAKKEGFGGFIKGIAKGVIGLPLKPVAGVFDFVSKSCEGLLHSLGRGYLINRRTHEYPQEQYTLDFYRAEIENWVELRGEQVSYMDTARFIERGRPIERYLVLTTHALYIINPTKLQDPEFMPKSIAIPLIGEILVPISPETQFIICLHPQHWLYDRQSFRFLVPDRNKFISRLRLVPSIKIKEINKQKL